MPLFKQLSECHLSTPVSKSYSFLHRWCRQPHLLSRSPFLTLCPANLSLHLIKLSFLGDFDPPLFSLLAMICHPQRALYDLALCAHDHSSAPSAPSYLHTPSPSPCCLSEKIILKNTNLLCSSSTKMLFPGRQWTVWILPTAWFPTLRAVPGAYIPSAHAVNPQLSKGREAAVTPSRLRSLPVTGPITLQFTGLRNSQHPCNEKKLDHLYVLFYLWHSGVKSPLWWEKFLGVISLS